MAEKSAEAPFAGETLEFWLIDNDSAWVGLACFWIDDLLAWIFGTSGDQLCETKAWGGGKWIELVDEEGGDD